MEGRRERERAEFSHEKRWRIHHEKTAKSQIEPLLHYNDSIMGD